ncbi:MAG TPA: ribonuclease Z [Clostridiales bacterium]|jgi:ribonuclease Z|nr:ribonuclease Z [Clostridiales bacterium]
MLGVCLLGCGGMTPLPERRLSSLLLKHNGKMILVDCGEGTQIGIKKLGWGFKSIEAVCLTHYHADHVAGLPGFLLTLGNSDRTEPLTIFGPPPLELVVRALTVIAPQLPYDIKLVELSEQRESYEKIGELSIKAMPMEHRIPCLAYSFELSRAGKFDVAAAESLGIPKEYWNPLQKGKTIEYKGRTLVPELFMGPPREGLKVTYSTDCRPTETLLEFCRNSDLLICEGMYADDRLLEKAKERKHMIFSEAANLALNSGAKELWLTHFSPSLKNPQDYISIPQSIFPNTVIGEELLTKELNFKDK